MPVGGDHGLHVFGLRPLRSSGCAPPGAAPPHGALWRPRGRRGRGCAGRPRRSGARGGVSARQADLPGPVEAEQPGGGIQVGNEAMVMVMIVAKSMTMMMMMVMMMMVMTTMRIIALTSTPVLTMQMTSVMLVDVAKLGSDSNVNSDDANDGVEEFKCRAERGAT